MSARFATTSCSQCGSEFGPGDHGFSSCKEHQPKASFTPGPWSLGESCDLLDRDGVIIESINETYDIRPAIGVKLGDELADMRLMAAAPDLLAALETIMGEVAGCMKDAKYQAARAAIAKAQGAPA